MALSEWLRTGYKTASGNPVSHQEEVLQLHAALMLLPSAVAVVKYKGCAKGTNQVTQGNDAADQAAKASVGYEAACMTQIVQTSEKSLK